MPAQRHITARLSFRKATTAQWLESDPVLGDAEPTVDTSANKFKIGDGISRWSELNYVQNLASQEGIWENTGTNGFPVSIQDPGSAIDYLRAQQIDTQNRVTALEEQYDGGTYGPFEDDPTGDLEAGNYIRVLEGQSVTLTDFDNSNINVVYLANAHLRISGFANLDDGDPSTNIVRIEDPNYPWFHDGQQHGIFQWQPFANRGVVWEQIKLL